ncbi:hypothetical protein [Kingella sp. (in: b-proteobacteria)]|uniref:hypothetical protein n=1 Tax=Kingella sp. (in: b-proteobacteria) TaxID=2020713 RepID=UPI0026DC21E3|nr:hypothetical protein [Kingella sp. (in: b-proteobacteria)]MDO4657026.1 hypothetical protein [Kingella sp. (in: b-proteobacteria)]
MCKRKLIIVAKMGLGSLKIGKTRFCGYNRSLLRLPMPSRNALIRQPENGKRRLVNSFANHFANHSTQIDFQAALTIRPPIVKNPSNE